MLRCWAPGLLPLVDVPPPPVCWPAGGMASRWWERWPPAGSNPLTANTKPLKAMQNSIQTVAPYWLDTYNVIKSGVPNAIRVFNEVLLPKGFRPKGIRIDSGDIAYLSKRARAMLDEAGFADVKITASNSLDEYLIRDLILQGAKVDLVRRRRKFNHHKSAPVFGGVYKLAAVQEQEGGEFIPKIKVSESVEKITTLDSNGCIGYTKENGKALADYITLYDETVVDDSKPLTIFDQHALGRNRP